MISLEVVRPEWSSPCSFARHAHAHRIAALFNSTQNLQYVAVSKDALPNSPADTAGCIKSFRLPKQAKISCVSFQAQYQAFVRFAVASSAALLSYRARLDLRFGTFHSGRALALRTLASTRNNPTGYLQGPTLDRCCEQNVVAPGEYSKWFFAF
jgi:hypothetical protein